MKTVFFGRKPHGGFRVLAAALLGVSVCGAAWAEEASQSAKWKKFSVSLDAAPLFKGLVSLEDDLGGNSFWGIAARFEYAPLPYCSAGVRAAFFPAGDGDPAWRYIGVTAHGRWYAFGSAPDKLFVDGVLGYNIENKDDGASGLTFGMGIGWKIIIKGSFFIEPSLYYMYSKGEAGDFMPNGWLPGLCIGMAF